MRQHTICIEDLSIGYSGKNQKKVVAQSLSATIHSGELTCLLGANGVGKSTLLRTLSGFLPKLSGQIVVEGRGVEKYTLRELARVIGVVLTDRFDGNYLTAREVVALGRSPYTGFWGKLAPEDGQMVDRSLSLVRADHLARRMIHSLSDGERQKVMIAKALAQDTPIVFLDEPTAFLDFPSKVELMQLLHQLSRSTGKTIFLSTHDLELALQIADKIWLMDDGGELTVGTPEDLSLDGTLERFFTRKGISFDIKSGLFRVEPEYTLQVRLEGEGERYAMAEKALRRNGIRAVREGKSEIRIEILKETPAYRIYAIDGSSVEATTIDEVMQQVCLHVRPSVNENLL
ncbi:MAG: ABC transporter ATP-binding protein [Bacteroides sp.]|nr:ABC transporter ATP-binding protein [Bacteroides sp.]